MREVPLTQGKVALVDDEDYERVNALKWYAGNTTSGWYAMREHRRGDGTRYCLYLHRFILGEPDAFVDHRNRNTMDCTRTNLRLASPSQNRMNSSVRSDNKSGYRGVVQVKGYDRWRAYIDIDGIRVNLGTFGTAEEASAARDQAARQLHGEFAALNTEAT